MSADVEITRPGKVLYPATGDTKADVVEHYEQVAGVMLPHLRDRTGAAPLPGGLDASGFFQKEASQHFPDWIRTCLGTQLWPGDDRHPTTWPPQLAASRTTPTTANWYSIDLGNTPGQRTCCSVSGRVWSGADKITERMAALS